MTTGGTMGTAGSRSGGASSTGGASASGGLGGTITLGAGGTAGGGTTASGGSSGTGGTKASGGSLNSGGAMTSGGSLTSGATSASAGTVGSGGSAGTGGGLTGGNTGMGGTGGIAAMCGDGTVDSGEQCDQGPDNQVSAAFWVSQSGRGFAATPLVRDTSNVDFYSYSSMSAHTGFEALGTSRIMLYLDRNTGLLSLILFHGIDQDSSGEEQPRALVVMQFIGLPETTTVDVVDDVGSNEFTMVSATEGTGYWNFTGNTDGVALGHLPFPGDWTTTITPAFRSGISVWTWIDGNGTAVLFDLSQPITIQARASHGGCRSNCSIPRCGDALLDGGEICDDGQPSTIGCSSDCKSFE